MNPDLDRLDLEFALEGGPAVRVVAAGFVIGAEARPELSGWVRGWTRVRKYFREGKLACWSADGERGLRGKRCEGCADRSSCARRLRVAVDRAGEIGDVGARRVTLELNYTSCRNFLAYARRIAETDRDVSRVPTRLSVVPHPEWVEVCFEVDADLFYAPEPAPVDGPREGLTGGSTSVA